MNPQDFLQTAQNLSGSQYEADMRSAISRAYYAALHTAFSALPEQRRPNLKARDKSSHSKVIDAYDGWSKAIEPKRTDKRLGALKNQLQHLGEVKVLGWKKQRSCISS